MKAMVLRGPDDLSLEEVPDPIPASDEVEIKVNFTGICGTDMNLIRGRYSAATYPLVAGHETMGEVIKASENSEWQPGDRVTVFPAYGCRACEACKAGRIAHCPEAKTVGVLRPGGYFSERIVAHSDRAFRLPDEMEDDVGAMVEPTAVAVHAVKRGQMETGAKVVVIGGGSIGLLTAQVARAYGASEVIISEPISDRRSVAREIGFAQTCNPLEVDLASFVLDGVGMVDVVFDLVGTDKTLSDSEEMLRPDGHLVIIALPHGENPTIPYQKVFAKELKVIGSRTYFMEDFPEAIDLLGKEKVLVKPLLSETLPLGKLSDAADLLEQQPGKFIKILVSPLM